MAYDTSKEEVHYEKNIIVGEDGESIIVGVYSYNNGDPKLGIRRTVMRKDKTTNLKALGPGKLGRMGVYEAMAIEQPFAEALTVLNKLSLDTAHKQNDAVSTIPQPPQLSNTWGL